MTARIVPIVGAIVVMSMASDGLMAVEPVVPAAAAEAGASPPDVRQHRVPGRSAVDERVAKFAKALQLDEFQQAKVKQILLQRQQEALRLRLDPSVSSETRIDRFRAMQVVTVEKIRAVLTEEQQQKYNPLATRAIPPAEGQRRVEDWLELTTPH